MPFAKNEKDWEILDFRKKTIFFCETYIANVV